MDIGFCSFHDGIWIYTGALGGVYYSIDGKTWIKSNITSGLLGVVCNIGKTLILIAANGSTGQGFYYSNDGKTWSQSNITAGGSFYINPVIFNGTIYVDVNRQWYCSVDGKTWMASDLELAGAQYANGIWICYSHNISGLLYSVDGMTLCNSNIVSTTTTACLHRDGIWAAVSNYEPYYSVTWEPSI